MYKGDKYMAVDGFEYGEGGRTSVAERAAHGAVNVLVGGTARGVKKHKHRLAWTALGITIGTGTIWGGVVAAEKVFGDSKDRTVQAAKDNNAGDVLPDSACIGNVGIGCADEGAAPSGRPGDTPATTAAPEAAAPVTTAGEAPVVPAEGLKVPEGAGKAAIMRLCGLVPDWDNIDGQFSPIAQVNGWLETPPQPQEPFVCA